MKMLKNESVEGWLKNVSVDELKIELILKLQRSDAAMKQREDVIMVYVT